MSGNSRLPVVVIPCFNEARRLDVEQLAALAGSERVSLLLVNDGSTDRTADVLAELSSRSDAIRVLELGANVGKAEAVRRGLLRAIDEGAPIVGYFDADLATPPRELLRLLDVLDTSAHRSFVMAARVGLLGRTIERRAARHYLGRVFATFASLALRLRVYDTQCGAKLFRVTPGVVDALSRPFRSSWVFDVELIGRLLRTSADPLPETAFEEVPLLEWHDVSGSKLGALEMARAAADLAVVAAELRRPTRPRR